GRLPKVPSAYAPTMESCCLLFISANLTAHQVAGIPLSSPFPVKFGELSFSAFPTQKARQRESVVDAVRENRNSKVPGEPKNPSQVRPNGGGEHHIQRGNPVNQAEPDGGNSDKPIGRQSGFGEPRLQETSK